MARNEIVRIFSNWLSCSRREKEKHCNQSCHNRGCWTASEMEEAVSAVLASLTRGTKG